jgi:hypothetical protein
MQGFCFILNLMFILEMMELLSKIIKWTNDNSGFISVVIFVLTLFIAWLSGLFQLIQRRPKFRIDLIEHDSFGCIFDLNRTHNDLPVNKTSFAVYLRLTNVGSAPSTIGKIRLGYVKSDLKPLWISSRLKNRKWIVETISKDDFNVLFEGSDRGKTIPFLKQRNRSYTNNNDTYLQEGRSQNGMVYFEQSESFGNWVPRLCPGEQKASIVIEIKDAYNRKHFGHFTIKMVTPEYAFRYNPYFGQTQIEYFKSDEKEGDTGKENQNG